VDLVMVVIVGVGVVVEDFVNVGVGVSVSVGANGLLDRHRQRLIAADGWLRRRKQDLWRGRRGQEQVVWQEHRANTHGSSYGR